MATKTQEDIIVGSNGKIEPPTVKQLSAFQTKHMKRLIANFERAKAGVDAAQDAANDFIVSCGEDMGIKVGADGWTFDVDSLEFVRVPPTAQEGGMDGDNS